MILKIELPQVGESVTEAEIGEWLKSPGDNIEKYEPIVEIITDKVSMELPAPETGVLTKIVVEEGQTVPMGAVVAEMETKTSSENEDSKSSGKTNSPSADRIGTLVQGANVGPTGGAFLDTSLDASNSADRSKGEAQTTKAVSRKHFSPVVTRLAAKHNIDLGSVTGTGTGGRVTKKDVLAAIEGGVSSVSPPEEPMSSASGDQVVIPSAIRRTIAEHMVQSKREIPHAWSAIEVDVTGMVAWREDNKAHFEADYGTHLTYLPVLLSAVAKALKANPRINSSWLDGKIILKEEIHVGVAVATDRGLVVPVIKNSINATIPDLARRLDEIIDRARSGKMTLEDAEGGTFTLNNTGALGSVWGGAIINYPQAAILTTEAIVKRPVVVSTTDEDSIEIRSMMNVCLSFDHRIVDGAEAAEFLQAVKKNLEAIDASFGQSDLAD